MSENRDVWVKNNKIDVDINSDFTKVALIFLLACIACSQCSSGTLLSMQNDLRKQQLEVAKKQYTLDSLRYYAPIKQR